MANYLDSLLGKVEDDALRADLIREIDPGAMLIVSSGYSTDPVVANTIAGSVAR